MRHVDFVCPAGSQKHNTDFVCPGETYSGVEGVSENFSPEVINTLICKSRSR